MPLISPHFPASRLPLALCAVVFIAAAGLSVFSGNMLRYPDEREYHQLALNLASGRGYVNEQAQPTASRPPGYPLLLALIYRLWERPLAAKLVNACALALTALVLSRLALAIQPGIGGMLAPALVLCYPLFTYTAGTLYPQTIGTLLFVASLFLIVRRGSWKTAALAGALFGFLILVIPSFLLLLPVVAAYVPISPSPLPAPAGHFGDPQSANRNPSGWRQTILFIVSAALVIAPWTIRNFIRFNAFIPVSSNSGINLLLGNSPNTRPNSGVNVDISDYERQTAGMTEVEKDRFFKQSAVTWIRGHPGAALRLYFQKVAGYFNYRNELYTRSESSHGRDAVMFLTYYPVLAAGVLRLCLFRRFPISRPELFLAALYLGNALLSAFFFTRIRFRVPFDAILIALAALFGSHIYSISSSNGPPPASALRHPRK